MKTISGVKFEIADLQRRNTELEFTTPREKTKAQNRMVFLKKALYYLESVNPSRELIERDIAAQEKIINSIISGYDIWKANNRDELTASKDPEKLYQDQNEIPRKKSQLLILKYLIKSVG